MKRAIVTGCSRGIGRAVTEMLLSEGWGVWGISRSDPGIEVDAFCWINWDLSHPPAPWGFEFVFWGIPVDALIHCAGIRGPHGPLEKNDVDAWVQTIQTNLIGTYRVVKAALPVLRRSDDARILLFSGGGAFDPAPGFSAYAVAKAGVVSLMETLAAEMTDTSVTVNAVAPGFVATGIHAGTPHEGKDDGGHAMADAVACVRHLLSPAARGLTGRTVSAAHDDWRHLSGLTIPLLTDQGTRTRRTVACLEKLLFRHKRAV